MSLFCGLAAAAAAPPPRQTHTPPEILQEAAAGGVQSVHARREPQHSAAARGSPHGQPSVLPALSPAHRTNMGREGAGERGTRGNARPVAAAKGAASPPRAARGAGWARPKPDALLPASQPPSFRRQSSPVVSRQRPPGIETQDVDTAPILPFSPDAGPDDELPRHDVRVVLIAPRRSLSDAAVSRPDERCCLEEDGENHGERCSEMGGAAEGEADSPMIKTKKKMKKKKAKSPANRARSISPRIRSLESPASSTTSDNISSPLDPQSPLSDASFRPAKPNAKSVGFAGVCEDGALSTKWKLVVDKNRTAGSGQVSCAKRTAEGLQFMSVVEVEGSQARNLLGKCIHMREGAGVERLDVLRLDSGHKINRFVDMGPAIGSKCNLFKQLVRMQTLFPHEYDFFPKTWNFPEDLEHFQEHALKDKIYFLKPTVGSQGKGIQIAGGSDVGLTYGKMCKELPTELEPSSTGFSPKSPSSASALSPLRPKTGGPVLHNSFTRKSPAPNLLPALKSSQASGNKCAPIPTSPFSTTVNDRHLYPNVCVQECIDPALLGLNKFDLRIYVLVESVMPLKAHVCRSAMLRKCMEEYKPLHIGDKLHKFSLLTNTSINKKYKPEYFSSAAGKDCKIPLHAAMDELEHHGMERDVLWAQIERIVSLTLCAVHPRLSLSYRACLSEHELQSHDTSKCFQILGFDIMFDSAGKARLLEVNTHPSLAWDTSVDVTIKRPAMAGQGIPEVLPTIKEFAAGGALSLHDREGVLKPESERRHLQWLQCLYTEVKMPIAEEDPHAAIGAQVLEAYLLLLRIESNAKAKAVQPHRSSVKTRSRSRCSTARSIECCSSPSSPCVPASPMKKGQGKRDDPFRKRQKEEAAGMFVGIAVYSADGVAPTMDGFMTVPATGVSFDEDGSAGGARENADSGEGLDSAAASAAQTEEEGQINIRDKSLRFDVSEVMTVHAEGDNDTDQDVDSVTRNPAGGQVKGGSEAQSFSSCPYDNGGTRDQHEKMVLHEITLGATAVAVLLKALRRLCIPEEALQNAFRANRRSTMSRLADVDPVAHRDSSSSKGEIQDISKNEYNVYKGKSLSFEAFYDGLYTVAFNVHHFAHDDSDSDSEGESDTLHDVFEGILSGLLMVLEKGDLPKSIQDYIVG